MNTYIDCSLDGILKKRLLLTHISQSGRVLIKKELIDSGYTVNVFTSSEMLETGELRIS